MMTNAWFVVLVTFLASMFGIAGLPYVPLGWSIVFAILILFEKYREDKKP